MTFITLEDLWGANVYLGHRKARCQSEMFPYIYEAKTNKTLIDPVKTARLLQYATNFVERRAQEGSHFLFIGTKEGDAEIVLEEAQRCEEYYVNNRWLGGLFTNWSTIQKRVDDLDNLLSKKTEGYFDHLPKKEEAFFLKMINKLEKNLAGVVKMKQKPGVVILTDPKKDIVALKECKKLGIITIALADTNCDPTLIDIPIPANKEDGRSIRLIVSKLASAVLRGKELKG
jgi:small subunit ribosomal protein S2